MKKNQGYRCSVEPQYFSSPQYQSVSDALTPLVGRDCEVQAVCTLLQHSTVRLLTLVGPGGIGKTRLALQIAAELRKSFSDGMRVVQLASVSESGAVLQSLMRTLDLHDSDPDLAFGQLVACLRDRHMLLVLDNFEQVIAASSLLVDLLTCCPKITMLVTSRAILRVRGEHEFPVSPLALPDLRHLPDHENLLHVPSISLFVQRAQAVKPDFCLTASNARCIAEICVWLDGVPLALELAAARIKHLSPHILLRRLERRLDVLTLGRVDMPDRQQTLRATLTWSYDLLTADERTLFRRLALFAGGCTLEQLESFCASLTDLSVPLLDVVASLIDKSFLQWSEQPDNEPRLLMLETVREYAMECLAASEEWEVCCQAHALCYIALIKEVGQSEGGTQYSLCLERLEQDYGNIRGALQWLLEHEHIEALLQLIDVLGQFWLMRGYIGEGRRLLAKTLIAKSFSKVAAQLQAKAYYIAGRLAFYQNDLGLAASFLEKSECLYQALEHKREFAAVLLLMGVIKRWQGADESGNTLLEGSLRLYRELDDQSGVADVLLTLGMLAHRSGDLVRARQLCEESLAISRAIAYIWAIAANLHYLGWIAYLQHNYGVARTYSEESLAHFRRLGRPPLMIESLVMRAYEQRAFGDEATALANLEEALDLSKETENRAGCALVLCSQGHLALSKRDISKAWALHEQCIALLLEEDAWASGSVKWILASSLEGAGEIAFNSGQTVCAVRLFGMAEAARALHGDYTPLRIERQSYQRTLASARSLLGGECFVAAWTEGSRTLFDRASVLDALRLGQSIPSSFTIIKPSSPVHTRLTARETEVLRLLASGLTNNQIANCLVLSPRTVNVHVQAVYRKLDVISRSAATRYAVEHNIV